MNREELKDKIYSILWDKFTPNRRGKWEIDNAVDEIAELFPLPPAEVATDKFRDVLNEVQRYIETNGGATESEMKAIWNSLSCAITESERRQQPTAEGAEEILKKHMNGRAVQEYKEELFIEYNTVVAAMQEFATLHAQRIADKMVSERLREELMTYEEWKHPSRARMLIEDKVFEYLRTREK